ncbi:MAG: toprim domain-containing protein [Puia sp.]
MTINQAKEMDMVEYLSRLGHEPQRISGKSYWYLSPLHDEKTASFKINRNLNRWYDFAEGKGGNLVDFGVLYHRCNVMDLLQKLNDTSVTQNLNKTSLQERTQKPDNENSIQVISAFILSSYPLMEYLRQRRIDTEIADKYCAEVRYKIGDKIYYAIGFKNDAGGYELRNQNFKGSSTPKDSTFIDNGAKDLAVFEGFFNFLSYQTLYNKQDHPIRNFLILNSASFFEKNLTKMQDHKRVHLFLDNDKTGQKCTLQALTLDKERFRDERHLYEKYNDLNDWIRHPGLSHKQQIQKGL